MGEVSRTVAKGSEIEKLSNALVVPLPTFTEDEEDIDRAYGTLPQFAETNQDIRRGNHKILENSVRLPERLQDLLQKSSGKIHDESSVFLHQVISVCFQLVIASSPSSDHRRCEIDSEMKVMDHPWQVEVRRALLRSTTIPSDQDTGDTLRIWESVQQQKRIRDSWRAMVGENKEKNESDASTRLGLVMLKDFDAWVRLIDYVTRRLFVVSTSHPLLDYATKTIPKLKAQQDLLAVKLFVDEARRRRKSCDQEASLAVKNHPTVAPCSMALIKAFQDIYSSPCYHGILLAGADEGISAWERRYPQACMPNAQLELPSSFTSRGISSETLSVTALYDIVLDEKTSELSRGPSICYITDISDLSVEQRETLVQIRTGSSCGCLLCRYEAQSIHIDTLDVSALLSLGHFYFVKGDLETAELLYKALLKQVCDHADAWHAIGAIALSRGYFVEAQKIWARAAKDHPLSCGRHPGIALQLEKINAYGYMENPRGQPAFCAEALPPSKSPFPNVFITPMVDSETCNKIRDWADELGEWTQQRHYAVPTHDVPVHKVPPLLKWFNNWMQTEMGPLLERQFENDSDESLGSNFYVHDAFCVRYQGTKASNYLPIHTDESTHSFVLALNNYDDYGGGGTYFCEHDTSIKLKIGEVLSFRGDKMEHGGEAVTDRERYILVAFLYHDRGSRVGKKRAALIDEPNTIANGIHGHNQSKISKFSFSFDIGG